MTTAPTNEMLARLDASQKACFDAGQHIAAMDIQDARAYIARLAATPSARDVREACANAAYCEPVYMGGNERDESGLLPPGSPYDRGRYDARKAILALDLDAAAPAGGGDARLAERISELVGEGDGFWRSCSGCYESNQGYPIGTYSKTFQCELGNGCSECGGIGAIWDNNDYSDLAAPPLQAPAHSYAVREVDNIIAQAEAVYVAHPDDDSAFRVMKEKLRELIVAALTAPSAKAPAHSDAVARLLSEANILLQGNISRSMKLDKATYDRLVGIIVRDLPAALTAPAAKATAVSEADVGRMAVSVREVAAQLSSERIQGWANPFVSTLSDASDMLERLAGTEKEKPVGQPDVVLSRIQSAAQGGGAEGGEA